MKTRSAVMAIVAAGSLALGGVARSETVVETSGETRFQLDLQVPAAAPFVRGHTPDMHVERLQLRQHFQTCERPPAQDLAAC